MTTVSGRFKNGRTHQLSNLLMAIYPRRAVGVAVVAFGLQHDAGVIVASAGHIANLTATNHLREILMTREQDLNIFVQTTASVMTGVDDDAFLQVVFA